MSTPDSSGQTPSPNRCREIVNLRSRTGGVPVDFVLARLAKGAVEYGDASHLAASYPHRVANEEEVADAYAYACMFQSAAEQGCVPALDDDDRSDLAQFFAAANRAWYVWNRMHTRRASRAAMQAECARECHNDCLTCDRGEPSGDTG